jgi:hypothetical protein
MLNTNNKVRGKMVKQTTKKRVHDGEVKGSFIQFPFHDQRGRGDDSGSVVDHKTIIPVLALCGQPVVALVKVLLAAVADPGQISEAVQKPS